MSAKKKLIRITTIPQSLRTLLKGQPKFMSSHFEVIGVSSHGAGMLDDVGKAEGINVIPVEMTRNITPIKDLKAAWQLYKVFKREKPFIVHTHTPKAGTVGMFAAFMARVPNRLHTIAGLPLLEIKGKKRLLLDVVEKLTYRFATKIYPNSFGLEEIILKNNYTKKRKLKVLGNGSSNGIDTNHFDPKLISDADIAQLKQDLGIDEKDFVYVFVGRVVKDKGINEMVTAFKEIVKEHTDVKLVLVGPFEMSGENEIMDSDALLPETTEYIKVSKQIMTVGFQKDVRPYFSISDCLVFPSYREGFPNVVMQAGALGLPAIVSDINGCNEIIIEGENGTIIPPKNVPLLQKAMIKYLLKGKIGKPEKGIIRSMIEDRYSQPVMWEAILQEYQKL